MPKGLCDMAYDMALRGSRTWADSWGWQDATDSRFLPFSYPSDSWPIWLHEFLGIAAEDVVGVGLSKGTRAVKDYDKEMIVHDDAP